MKQKQKQEVLLGISLLTRPFGLPSVSLLTSHFGCKLPALFPALVCNSFQFRRKKNSSKCNISWKQELEYLHLINFLRFKKRGKYLHLIITYKSLCFRSYILIKFDHFSQPLPFRILFPGTSTWALRENQHVSTTISLGKENWKK